MSTNPILWQPAAPEAEQTAMYRFMTQQGFREYSDLHAWSTEHPSKFWPALADFCGVRFSTPASKVIAHPDNMMRAGWFEGSKLNYAEFLLRETGDKPAIVFFGEDASRREISFTELRASVAAVAEGLRQVGIEKGDRVAGYLPNCPEAIVAMLATSSLGAIWSSCSPDFGLNGVVDRFGQISPKVLFTANAYRYNGKTFDCLETAKGIAERVDGIDKTVVVPFVEGHGMTTEGLVSTDLDSFSVSGSELRFEVVDFSHPLFIMYSSGTTGVPKCIVHGHGGTLLQHLKEHMLHCDLGRDDRIFYFTTCGWMMWNWLASALATGATLVLFDGSPFFNDGNILWQLAEQESVTVFGTSAKYISAQEKAGIEPGKNFDLGKIRLILSTGSPLAPASFDYVYDAISPSCQLASIAGGTDIISCFVLGNPLLPVRRGEIQCAGLGMNVKIFDDDGQEVLDEHGELVCTTPFPSAPVGFWNDDGDARYQSAYFERFPGLWAHGDYAEQTEEGGFIIHGRSDSVLNPGGVRIGTAEIYRQVEKLEEIAESIVIGQNWADDVRVVLFVVLQAGISLSDELVQKIRSTIRSNTTPRHVPAKVLAVTDIPRTKSGKIVEVAVRSVVHGDLVKNTEALANPEALDLYRDLAELQSD